MKPIPYLIDKALQHSEISKGFGLNYFFKKRSHNGGRPPSDRRFQKKKVYPIFIKFHYVVVVHLYIKSLHAQKY